MLNDMAPARRRTKRQAGVRNHMEVMVVIDHTVINFHGEETTELFVLAVFNMVTVLSALYSLSG